MSRQYLPVIFCWPLCGLLLLSLVLGGCAQSGNQTSRRSDAGRAGENPSVTARAKPARPALLEIEEDVGFTVTEVVRLPDDVRVEYQRALALLAQKDYERGIALLLAVTGKVPEATAPFVDLGIAYGLAGDDVKAQASFEGAIAATPDHPVAHNELGIVFRRLGRFAEARASYERALDIYPGFHYARRNLAILCDLYLADLSCALSNYEIYQEAVPDDQEVAIWIGDTRNRLGPVD